jgi:hypothetical protein
VYRPIDYFAAPRTHNARAVVPQPPPPPRFRLPELKQKVQASPLGFVDPLNTQASLKSIDPLALYCLVCFESKMASNSSIFGKRQSENPPVRRLLQYWWPWLGLTESPLSLTVHVNPVALSVQTAFLSAPAAGFESWPITMHVPQNRMAVVSIAIVKLLMLLFENIDLILPGKYAVLS